MERAANPTTASRGIINSLEALALRVKSANLAPAIAQHTLNGTIEIPSAYAENAPIVRASIGEEGAYAELHGVIVSSGARLHGTLQTTPTHRLWLPDIHVTAQLVSDLTASPVESFDSSQPHSLATKEHFTVVSELMRRISTCAGKCTVEHSTLY